MSVHPYAPNRLRARALIVGLTSFALLALALVVSRVVAREPADSRLNATPVVDVEQHLADARAEQEAFLASLKLPDDLRTLPRMGSSAEYLPVRLDTLADKLGPSARAADAVVRLRVTGLLKAYHNESSDFSAEVLDVIAIKEGFEIARGPFVLRQAAGFQPGPVLVVSEAFPMVFPGEEAIMLLEHLDFPATGDSGWMPMMWTGVLAVEDGVVSARVGFGEAATTDELAAMPGSDRALVEWRDRYQKAPLAAVVAELRSAARAAGWSTGSQ